MDCCGRDPWAALRLPTAIFVQPFRLTPRKEALLFQQWHPGRYRG